MKSRHCIGQKGGNSVSNFFTSEVLPQLSGTMSIPIHPGIIILYYFPIIDRVWVPRRCVLAAENALETSTWPDSLFRGGKIVLEQSRGTKSEGFFHTLCLDNKMDNVCTGKNEVSSISTRTKVEPNQSIRKSPLATKIKQQRAIAKKFPGVTKSWHSVAQGWHLPPHATP